MLKNKGQAFVRFLKGSRRHFAALAGVFLLAVFVKLFGFWSGKGVGDDAYKQYFSNNYKVFGVTLPKDLNFASEQVPVDDFTVREAIDRELLVNTYWQSQTLLFAKRANRWFPRIEPILKQNGVPEDFKYVALIESGFMNVVSPQQAAGFWQLIEPTAENYGLEVDENVDERYNVEKSTQAACKYFKEAYAKYKNWTLAAASYNLGMGGIDKALEKQKATNYYDLYLNEETSRYVYRLLAVKELLTRPKVYGYELRPKDLYPPVPVTTLKVDSTITDLATFAINHGTTYKLLKYMNPWLLKSDLQNTAKKAYDILIPKAGVKIYGMDDSESGSSLTADSTRFVSTAEVRADSLIHAGRDSGTSK